MYDYWQYLPEIEEFCYTPGEFEKKKKKKQIGLVKQAVKEGIEL
jgi:hypothetical protein